MENSQPAGYQKNQSTDNLSFGAKTAKWHSNFKIGFNLLILIMHRKSLSILSFPLLVPHAK